MDYTYLTGARAWLAFARGERSAAQRIAPVSGRRGACSYGQIVFEAFARHDLARLGDPAAVVDQLRSLANRWAYGELIPTFAAHAAALRGPETPSRLERVATGLRSGWARCCMPPRPVPRLRGIFPDSTSSTGSAP